MQQPNSDVVILGGGVIGLTCAHYLLQAGRSVTLLEQGKLGGGASHGNCGTITPSHATPLAMPGMLAKCLRWMLRPDAPFYIKPRLDFALLSWLLRFYQSCSWNEFKRISAIKAELLNISRDQLIELVKRQQLDCEFACDGTLYVFRNPRAFEHSRWLPETLQQYGITIQTLDAKSVCAMEPALNDSIVAGYFNPGDAHLRPERYMAELARLLRKNNCKIYENTKVLGVKTTANTIDSISTDQGEFAGQEVILALGAWSPQLAKQLDVHLPIQPGKGYSITYDRPTPCPRIPLVLKERSVCVTSWSTGYRLGSTMEFSGYDDSLNRRRLDALVRGAAEYLQQPVGPRVVEEWYGWRPMTYDDLPVIGRAPGWRNLTLATGHGMLGVSLSAITGILVSELLAGVAPSIDLAPFAPMRFY